MSSGQHCTSLEYHSVPRIESGTHTAHEEDENKLHDATLSLSDRPPFLGCHRRLQSIYPSTKATYLIFNTNNRIS